MKKVAISELSVQNFQGIKKAVIPPGSGDIKISGSNATGKTTLANAISWIFTGKNIYGESDFEIKTLDELGEEKHNLEHNVTANLSIDIGEVLLSKTLKEKWVKQRGSTHQEYTLLKRKNGTVTYLV